MERDESDPRRRIKRLGGDGFNHSILEVIKNLHQETCRYWLVQDAAPVWIVLDTRPSTAYLRAEADAGEPESLFSVSIDDG